MATNRSKATANRSSRRSTPSQRRRVQLQPLQGRYPVLPPIDGHSGWPGPPYQTAAQQNFMFPAMPYSMTPFHQMMPYMPQPAVPLSVYQPQMPYMALPTSTMCYYTAAPWPVYQWTEPNDVIAELLPDDQVNDQCQRGPEDSSSYMHQTLKYYDPMVMFHRYSVYIYKPNVDGSFF